jgi:glycosyltransferase involved in cell wall biosynthesis
MAGGGAERQLTLLASELVACGVEVHVALLAGGPNEARLLASGAVVHRISSTGNHDPAIAFRLRSLARQLRTDIVQTWLPQMDVFGGVAARLAAVPWILSERVSAAAYEARWKDRVLRRRIGARADGIIANSERGLDYWRPIVGYRTHLEVIPNIVPSEDLRAAACVPPSLDLAPGVPMVLAAGRLVEQKNLSVLLAALRLVFARTSAVAFICGDGPVRPALELEAAAHGLTPRLRFLGYRNDLWSLMGRAQAFVSPSLFEGQPNTVLEAMACGCPLVLSDIREHREIADDSTATFVPPCDADALASAVIRVLNAGLGDADDRDIPEVLMARSPAAIGWRYATAYNQVVDAFRAANARRRRATAIPSTP